MVFGAEVRLSSGRAFQLRLLLELEPETLSRVFYVSFEPVRLLMALALALQQRRGLSRATCYKGSCPLSCENARIEILSGLHFSSSLSLICVCNDLTTVQEIEETWFLHRRKCKLVERCTHFFRESRSHFTSITDHLYPPKLVGAAVEGPSGVTYACARDSQQSTPTHIVRHEQRFH